MKYNNNFIPARMAALMSKLKLQQREKRRIASTQRPSSWAFLQCTHQTTTRMESEKP